MALVPTFPNPNDTAFKVYGKYAYGQDQPIKTSDIGICIGGGYSGKSYLKKGTLVGLNLTYISKTWHVWNPETLDTFYEELYFYAHKRLLKPLMGICVPMVVGVYGASAGRLSIAMEPPHHIGWREADPYISLELKESILDAYRKIHAQGVLHNDAELRHMLIGDDDRVTIIDFGISSSTAKAPEFALEIRKVKFLLDYKGAKEEEYARLRRAEARHSRNMERLKLRLAAPTVEDLKAVEADEPPTEEEIDYPPFLMMCLEEWDSEVATEGRDDGPGWRGKRYEVPSEYRLGPFVGPPGFTYEPLPLETYEEVNFGECARAALKAKDKIFETHNDWMPYCRYATWLWIPPPPLIEPSTNTSNEPPPLTVIEQLMAAETAWYAERAAKQAERDEAAETAVRSKVSKRGREEEEPEPEGSPPRKRRDFSAEISELGDDRTSWQLAVPPLVHEESSSSESGESIPSLPRSDATNQQDCQLVVIDENKRSNVWAVTHQMMEDILGYLRVKILPKSRQQKRQENSDAESSSAPSRKRKRVDTDAPRPDKKRRA